MSASRQTFAVLATLCAALPLAASAQTSVTLYGLVDLGVRLDKTSSGTISSVQSGMESGSRWGLRGVENLGGGLKASFNLEAGFQADTGVATTNGAPAIGFGRQAAVWLASERWGAVGLGRQMNPIFNFVAGRLDPFAFGYVGSVGNTIGLSAGAPARSSNAITYSAPLVAGIKGDFLYALGESAKPGLAASAGNATGLSVYYADQSATLGYSFHQTRGTADVATSPRQTRHVVGGNYDFKVVKLYAAYATNRNDDAGTGRIDRAAYALGLSAPLGGGMLMAQYQSSSDRSAANADTSQLALGYTYFLSKRVDLYTAVGKTRNRNSAAFGLSDATNNTLGVVAAGSSPKALQMGMRYRF